jgi:hypothetical protein
MFASPGRLTFLCEAKSDCLWQWICPVDFAGIGTKRIHQTSSALIVNRILQSNMVREIDTKPWWGRTNKICDFDASPHVVALSSGEHQRNRALRDREAHSEGVRTSFVISMLPFGCSGWSIKHGPRDRHKTLVGAYRQDLRFRCFLQSIIGAIEIAWP